MQPVAIKSQRDMLIRAMGFLNGELRSKGQLESDGHVTWFFFLIYVDALDVCIVTLGKSWRAEVWIEIICGLVLSCFKEKSSNSNSIPLKTAAMLITRVSLLTQ